MKPRRSLSLAGLCGCTVTLASAAAFSQEELQPLRFNPFDRPEFILNLGQAAPVTAIEQPAELELRATLVAGDGGLADINGEILRVGETIGGYRIQRITEGRVVLSNSGGDLVLDVYARQRQSEQENSDD